MFLVKTKHEQDSTAHCIALSMMTPTSKDLMLVKGSSNLQLFHYTNKIALISTISLYCSVGSIAKIKDQRGGTDQVVVTSLEGDIMFIGWQNNHMMVISKSTITVGPLHHGMYLVFE